MGLHESTLREHRVTDMMLTIFLSQGGLGSMGLDGQKERLKQSQHSPQLGRLLLNPSIYLGSYLTGEGGTLQAGPQVGSMINSGDRWGYMAHRVCT